VSRKTLQIMSDEHKRTIKTKHGELTLEQLAETQPGMARLMKEVSDRYYILYYAAKGGNWMLAQHELNQVASLFKVASTLRPKYAEDLASFTKDYFVTIGDAIKARDWARFEKLYNQGVDKSNAYHEKYGYEYIRFVLPKTPPAYYDLKPPSAGSSGGKK